MDSPSYPPPELPRQDSLLRTLVPGLVSLDQTRAVWLTGSLARGDADRWSSVDLHLLWGQDHPGQTGQARPSLVVRNSIEETLGKENILFEQVSDSETGGSLQGICLGTQSEVDTLYELGPAGVLFELSWALSTKCAEIAVPDGAIHLLYSSGQLAGGHQTAPDKRRPAVGPADVDTIDRQLRQFWLLLARLPAVVGRHEQLAAHLLLAEIGALLIDLVVLLNGGSRPKARARINQYLGLAQLEAFEKSLELRKTGRRREEGTRANWIGQAVALVVLYRWYAPQLAEKYSLNYPRLAEDSVLAYLNVELKNWPARITTG